MTITQESKDKLWTIAVDGRLDTNSSPELEAVLNEEPEGFEDLILDFGNLDYISSAGLRVVLLALKKINKTGKTMKVLNVAEAVYEVFELTGFVDILDIERKEA